MNPDANPRVQGYHWPSMIHRNMAKLVEKFLSAKDSFNRGSRDPLEQFFQKEMAEPWSHMTAFDPTVSRNAEYDIKSEWPGEKRRFMTVDCQIENEFYSIIRHIGALFIIIFCAKLIFGTLSALI